MTLKEQISKFPQVYPCVRIHVGQYSWLADGGFREEVYGAKTLYIDESFVQLNEAWEFWKGLIAHNPRATKTEKIPKFTRLAEVLKRPPFSYRGTRVLDELADLTGQSKSTIRRFLPSEYKMVSKDRSKICNQADHKSRFNIKRIADDGLSSGYQTKSISHYDALEHILNWLDCDSRPRINSEDVDKLRAIKGLIIKWLS